MDWNVTYREKNGAIQAVISYKDSSGSWKQKSKQGYKTQKEAKSWIDETVEALSKAVKYIDADHLNDKFEQLYDAFVEHIELYNQANTINSYYRAKIHFETLNDIQVQKITAMNIQKCVDDMVKRGMKATTINSHIVKLKTVFNYAIKTRVLKENPVFNITMPEDKNKTEKVKALTKSEIGHLLSKIFLPKYYFISLIAVTCGLRLGEILALKWSDIDEKNKMITVNKQWKLLNYKPETYGEGIVKRPNSNRVVPIPNSTMDELKKYKDEHPIDISGRLFPYKNSNAVSCDLRTHYKKIGFKISVHDLRHTYVSLLVAKGLDFQTIASLIGDTVAITIKTYSHFTEDMMTKAKNAVENIL